MDETLLRLGGISLCLRAADPRLAGLAASAVGAAAAPDALPSWKTTDLTLHLLPSARPGRPVFPPRVNVRGPAGARAVRVQRYDGEAAWLERDGQGLAVLQPSPLALRGLLQLVVSVLLPCRSGLAVHAASLVHRGSAYLFPARSGIGKSTLVRGSGGEPALADEISLVAATAKGTWLVFPSPFWSKDGQPPAALPLAAAAGYPLRRICFIEQSPTAWRRPLAPAAALDQLLGHVLAHDGAAALAGQILDVAAALCSSTPAEQVGVPLGAPVWPWLVPEQGD